MNTFSIKGNLVDIINKDIYYAELIIAGKKIKKINRLTDVAEKENPYILPGFIDSHVHIESSMLVPSEFAKLAVVHGTVATISDPHEIANVCGMEGINFMIDNGKTVPFKFHFGAPSCVPATIFETAGAEVNVEDVTALLQSDDIFYLSEMMNFPGVLNNDETVVKKIMAAQKSGKPVDGHAPGLRSELAKKYIDAGITTDHECFTAEEALDKIAFGMKILIREGSAAKNFEALIDLLQDHPDKIMFCSDDKHPDSLEKGHINELCARAVAKGIDIFKVLQAACINPVEHYKMTVGLLRENDMADFIVVNDLEKFNVIKTFVNGILVAEKGKSLIKSEPSVIINNFNCELKQPSDFVIPYNMEESIPVIEALDGQLITNKIFAKPLIKDNKIVSNIDNDTLKIVVVNRYNNAPVAKAFIKNFNLNNGAIASSVAHDSHNIVAIGVDDESICRAVNLIINEKGGISCVVSAGFEQAIKKRQAVLSLPVAGLMSNSDGYKIAADYTAMDTMAKECLGCTLTAPFMTLSFMALLVIPHLKLSDRGLFDGDEFKFL
jgi:adenine deaminase